MRSKRTRVLAMLALVTAAGVLFAGSGLACTSMFGQQAMTAFDTCFLFDCQNGAIGGLVDFCSVSGDNPPMFLDCPEYVRDVFYDDDRITEGTSFE